MRRVGFLAVMTSCLAGLAFLGCSQKADVPKDQSPSADHARAVPLLVNGPDTVPGQGLVKTVDFLAAKAPEPTRQEKYEAALLDAFNLLADKKCPEALRALETARTLQDTDQVQAQIAHLRAVIDEQAAAAKTVQDIQTVLGAGKAEDAARLATAGLQQYGGTDAAGPLSDLKRQADTLSAAALEDRAAKQAHFRQEGDDALKERNLRAAAIAYEQALESGDDPALRQQYEEVRATLTRYDENRRRAAELRRDPGKLEDAVAALQEAAKAWDTLQIHQDIEECNLALEHRRDRLSVAEFEVRGDVGIPDAGRAVAEELLGAFKPRFDLAEREQVNKVIRELNLEASELGSNDNGRREVGRLANVRFLVLGSITAVNGITVNARLVDVRSGLVVQTAKLVARSPEELLPLLPQLANQLMMSDDQKMAYQQQMASAPPQVAPPVTAVSYEAPLPPPPEVLGAGQPVPPPVIAYAVQPLALGGLTIVDFQRLPPPPPPEVPAVTVVIERENPFRKRLLHIAVELGDNLFRRGRYREAHAQFQLALNLSPDSAAVRLRIDHCQPHLPPPAPVVLVAPPPAVVIVGSPPPPVLVAAPPSCSRRIAVLSFVVNADPGLVPASMGDWASEQIASYFTPQYEVVDRGEVCWYMGRLGITMRDVLADPAARISLGQALNVRSFVFGTIEQTHSFNVTTHLVDVQTGARQSGGSIHVQDTEELKLRLSELAGSTQADPAKQAVAQREARENEKRLNEARQLLKQGQPQQAAAVCQEGLKQQPNNVALQALLQQAQQQVRVAQMEEARRKEAEQRQAQAAAARKQQEELAKQAALSRLRAQQEAAGRSEAARRAEELRRQQAADQLLAQGDRALKQKNYPQAIQLLQSAVAMHSTDAAVRELAEARTQARAAEQELAAQEQQKRREAEEAKKKESLAKAEAKVAEERREFAAQEEARRKAQEARDEGAYQKLLDEGKRLLAEKKYDAAVATLRRADQVRKTREGEELLKQALDQQARAKAPATDTHGQAEAKKKAEEYQKRMRAGRLALSGKNYDAAIQAFRDAQAVQPGDPAAAAAIQQAQKAKEDMAVQAAQAKKREEEQRAAQQRAEKAQNDARMAREAEARRAQEEQKRQAEFTRWMNQGQAALAGKRYAEAVQAFGEAAKLRPGDPGAAGALRASTRSLQASQAPPPPPARPSPPPPRPPVPPAVPNTQAEYARQMQTGAALEKQQKYAEAMQVYEQALRLVPNDARASAALKNAEFSFHMAEGRKAGAAKRYPDAAREYDAALKALPGQPEATAALKRAREGRP